MSEEEIYKMLLTENIEKFPLLNEIFAIRNNKFKINNYTIYVTGCISLDVINRAIEKVNLIDKLQEENKDLKKEIDNLIRENHKHIDYIASMKKKQEDKIKAFKKENEKLKDRIEYLGNEKHALYQDNISLLKEKYGAESLNYKYIEMPPVEVKGYISEDKIRAKIKELEKTKNYIISMYAIGILEELLGDDE